MLLGRMSLASRLPTFLPPTSWLLFLVCISPSFCAALWESHSGSNDVVRLEHGPKFNIPDALRRQAWSGRTAEDGVPVRIQQYPAKLDLNQGFEPQSDDESSSEWETVLDPRFYIITELGNSGDAESASQGIRKRRNANPSPSLSIVNPLDVLRQRLLFEIARRRQIQSHSQIRANNEILRNIGRK